VFVELIEQLARGATVATPNRRLAAAIRRAYDRHVGDQGQSTWPAADVLPWSVWLERGFREGFVRGAVRRLLMSHWQARALWQRVIAEAPEAQGLLHVTATAVAALQAWELAHAWRLLPALHSIPLTDEPQAFLRWARAYEAVCAHEQLTDQARLPDLLRDLVLVGSLVLPRRLVVFGFDALTPQQGALLEALGSRGVTVEVRASSGDEAPAVVLRHPGPTEEIRAAAAWVRSCIAADPQARVGVVVPELTRLRPAITRIFDEVLLPDALLHPGRTPLRPWNVSLGVPLADWPLAHAALLILELAAGWLTIHRAGLLLRSPFVGGAESERTARALLDARLRRLGDPHITLDGLIYHAGLEGHAHSCGLLAERLAALRARLGELPASAQPVSFWGPALQSLLSAMQWPGERELNSEEYQTFQKWKELMAGLAQLDLVCAPVTLDSAVGTVRRLAGEELFQPETPEVPVQVLGLLESAQLEFDRLFVLGLTDAAWPRMQRPNPLLPVELQRSRGLPGSSAEWELGFARRRQAGWCRAAPRVVFSYHCADGDLMLGASPLLAGLPERTLPELGTEPLSDWRAAAQRLAMLESVADWQGNVLPEGVAFAGGARLIRDQAACPFRAFAAHRLGAASLEHPHEGLDARDRGILLHAALAALWSELSTQQRLATTPHDELVALVARCVDSALRRLHPRRASSLRAGFLALERERLVALLQEWLQVERRRAEFQVVACEADSVVNVAGLNLKLRLDRVDRLPGGSELLIDYKAGSTSIATWMGERPDEPQLPLYCLARPVLPEAVAFARVRRGECALTGLSAQAGVADGVTELMGSRYTVEFPAWSALLAAWRARLQRLAVAFRSGAAPVDPKQRAVTCRNCDLATLCRVSELVDRGSPTAGEDSADE
jgi:ATP-dependent helicase/nuclease subunit B